MDRKYVNLILILISFVAFAGCGGGGGAPGSGGSENTGILIKAVSLSLESPDIDVFQSQTACDGEPEDPLTREDATITIDAARINPNIISDPLPASVEECTITYLKANQDPASPVLESLTIYPNCVIGDGASTCNVTFIDIARKNVYANAVLFEGINSPAEYPTHYVARYRCKYRNNFGDSGFFQVEYDFWLADFEKCGGE